MKGEGNQQDYGFRIYDPRVAKFLSVDPITKSYPELTPYQFASNNPIQNIDLDGLEKLPVTGEDFSGNPHILFDGLRAKNDITVESRRHAPSNHQAIIEAINNHRAANAIIIQSFKCHPDNTYLLKERARILEQYAKLDYAHGQVALPRGAFIDFILGGRSKGRWEINADGYLTGKMRPIAGMPPAEVTLGRGFGGLSQFESVTAGAISRFISTEEAAQSMKKVESFKDAIKSGDWSIWAERIDAVKYGGETYILNGHNRLKAVSELGGDAKFSIYMMSTEDAVKFYKSKFEDIQKGLFKMKISE